MVTSKIIASGILKAISALVVVGLFLFFIYKIYAVFVYLISSIIFSLIANPLVEFFRKKLKFGNTFAVIVTLLLFMVVICGVVLMFVPLIVSQGNNLSQINTQLLQSKIVELYNNINLYLNSHNVDATKLFNESKITSKLNFNFFTNFINSIISSSGNLGITVGSTFFISFFFLKDKVTIISSIRRMLPENQKEKIINSANKIKSLLTRYFIGLIVQLTVICILYYIILLIFKVDNAFVIAFLCALLNIVPYVGAFISMILVTVFSLLGNINQDFQSVALPTTLYILIGFLVVQVIDNNISQPIIFSKSINSHPLEIFLIILISGILFGVTGMIIAIPSYTIIKVVGKEFFPENKIISALTKNL
jgi:predicted PurR-regulated permease PerM